MRYWIRADGTLVLEPTNAAEARLLLAWGNSEKRAVQVEPYPAADRLPTESAPLSSAVH